jgi:Ser/Thr protein kinase RdoA (MazF antagonist)
MKILRSIISPQSIAQIVSKDYGISSQNIRCELLKAGGSNDVYLIKYFNKKFVVKLYSNRQCWPYLQENFLLETEIMDFLYNHGIILPKLILNLEHSFVSKIQAPEYDKYYTLCSYIQGTHHDNLAPDYKRLFYLGQSLAFLHNSSKHFVPSNNFNRKIDLGFLLHDPKNRINKVANISKKLLLQLNELYDDLCNKFEELDYSNLPSGIIHGDMHSGNHKYIRSRHQILFLDFELCGLGWNIYDLAVFRWNLFFLDSIKSRDKAWKSFFNGYTSINELTNMEYNAIELFVKIRHFFFLGSTAIIYPDAAAYNNTRFIQNIYNMIDGFVMP